jgi:hypothetical protein
VLKNNVTDSRSILFWLYSRFGIDSRHWFAVFPRIQENSCGVFVTNLDKIGCHQWILKNKGMEPNLSSRALHVAEGSVIMDVTTPEQARIAEAAGAIAVIALQKRE